MPGNHDLGDGSGEQPLVPRLLDGYRDAFGPDHWVVGVGPWRLLGINAQLLGSGSSQEQALWGWIEDQAGRVRPDGHSALFLHRPVFRPGPAETARKGRYVSRQAVERLLDGPLRPTLRLVVSGHAHQYLDLEAKGVRHVWMPSSAFILPDEMQTRIGEKLVGIGLLDIAAGGARFDLWCPDGMARHDVSSLTFYRTLASQTNDAE